MLESVIRNKISELNQLSVNKWKISYSNNGGTITTPTNEKIFFINLTEALNILNKYGNNIDGGDVNWNIK